MTGNPKHIRKIIRIKATDSPNVKWALYQKRIGEEVTGERLLPGVLSWEDYLVRLKTWDKIKQCVSLNGEFYEGAENLMFPPMWLDASEEAARMLNPNRQGKTMGVDPAMGGDDTSWAISDDDGLIELISMKTPDTTFIPNKTISLIAKHKIKPENVWFDQGGGGQVHVDSLRERGYNVSVVSFAEGAPPQPIAWGKHFDQKVEDTRESYSYKNRRAQMYHFLRLLMDPFINTQVFAIPERYSELRRQLAPIPITYDEEGRIFLLPKRRKPFTQNSGNNIQSLTELIGRSPDDADALVLSVFGLCQKYKKLKIKSLF